MPRTFVSWESVVALVVVLCVAAWLIRRAGAGLREQLGTKAREPRATLTPDQLAAITSQGLATPDQLFAMSSKEQQLLAATAMAMRGAQNQRRTREQ